MANPIIVACAADTWVKVATGITSGNIHIRDTKPNRYLQTYRLTTQAAPTDDADAIPFDPSVLIATSASSDIYVKAIGAAGSVRVDL